MNEIFSKELITVLVAAAPVSELRGAIPLAVTVFGMNVYKAFILSVIGNFLPVLPLLAGLERSAEYLGHRVYFFNRFFAWLFERTRRKHNHHFEFWGRLALFVFVAIPLPLTGAWSGAVAAFVFGIPLWKAAFSIALGIVAAGAIVAVATTTGLVLLTY